MKKAFYPIIILVGALSSVAPAALPPTVFGPAEVAVHGVGQNLNELQTINKTNVVGGTTNFIQAFKSNTTNFTINTESLFALLENSLNTNFPAGCRLLLVEQGEPRYAFFVSDTSGTNADFNPNQVLSSTFLSGSTPLFSGAATEASTNSPGGAVVSGKDTETYSTALTFTYDDTALTNTADGTHTKFKWVGIVRDKSLLTTFPTNQFHNENVTIELLGGGLVRIPTNLILNQQNSAIFTGSIRAKVTGFGF